MNGFNDVVSLETIQGVDVTDFKRFQLQVNDGVVKRSLRLLEIKNVTIQWHYPVELLRNMNITINEK